MKAITLWQPWASLLACNAKKYETRSWATKYRGQIAIHAAMLDPTKIICDFPSSIVDKMTAALLSDDLRLWSDLPRGKIIAIAELINCHEIYESNSLVGKTSICIKRELSGIPIIGNELLFGDWQPSRYAWEFTNMTMLPEPIPEKGGQRIWNWNEVI